ncbi:hypothetical protein BH23GEM7_BH23GEM7_23420 [soil metagenome]
MTFEHFERRAQRIFAEIPPEFKRGVDGLMVLREESPHPSLPDVYTLGECRTEAYPSEFGGPGEVRSLVVLFHGSFRRLAELDEHFDWEEELWETITHEVRHHLESLADEDALEEHDYADDQNFARRQGESFDPLFYRAGVPSGERVFEVSGDVFIEREMDPDAFRREPILTVEWEGEELRIPRPDRLGDVHFVSLGAFEESSGELFLVLLRRRGVWESVRSALSGAAAEVLQTEADPL